MMMILIDPQNRFLSRLSSAFRIVDSSITAVMFARRNLAAFCHFDL